MFGKELHCYIGNKKKIENERFKMNFEELFDGDEFVFEIHNRVGDNIRIEFDAEIYDRINSYLSCLMTIFYFGDNYWFGEGNTIKFNRGDFWNYYKKIDYGRDIIIMRFIKKLTINDLECKFAQTDAYFDEGLKLFTASIGIMF